MLLSVPALVLFHLLSESECQARKYNVPTEGGIRLNGVLRAVLCHDMTD